MPLQPELTEEYADALQTLRVASDRAARVTNISGHYALHVDLGGGRYISATNTDVLIGLKDADTETAWRVQILEPGLNGADSSLLADCSAAWLVDAYDAAVADLPPRRRAFGE